MDTPSAATIVAEALARRDPEARADFLRELLAHTAAGLTVIAGHVEASESVYRMADAIVARSMRSAA